MFEDPKYACRTNGNCFETECEGCKAVMERIAQAIRLDAAEKQQKLRKALHVTHKPKTLKS